MNKDSKTVLEWTYEPRNFFEAPCPICHAGGTITITEGEARGEFDASYYSLGREFSDAAHEHLTTVFMAQQVQEHREYKLSGVSMSLVHPDGRRDVTLMVATGRFVISGGHADFVVRDAHGNVIQDTKAERLEKQKEFRKNIEKLPPDNLILKRMLQSFRNALTDNSNFLIHLYEVQDSLFSKFGGNKTVKIEMNVSSADWKKFNYMANKAPLLKGRHRGKHTNLSSATTNEKKWALSYAQALIEEYVRIESER